MQRIAKSLNLNDQWLYSNPWEEIQIALKHSLNDKQFKELLTGKTLKLKLKPKNQYQTLSGKISFEQIEGNNYLTNPNKSNDKLFILISSSTPKYTSTQFQDVYGKIPPVVIINPEDALNLRIINDDKVMLSNKHGIVKLKAKVSDNIAKGVLWIPRQGEDLTGISINSIMNSNPQKLGNGSSFNSTEVNLYKFIKEKL